MIYLDTSALVALFANESNTPTTLAALAVWAAKAIDDWKILPKTFVAPPVRQCLIL